MSLLNKVRNELYEFQNEVLSKYPTFTVGIGMHEPEVGKVSIVAAIQKLGDIFETSRFERDSSELQEFKAEVLNKLKELQDDSDH